MAREKRGGFGIPHETLPIPVHLQDRTEGEFSIVNIDLVCIEMFFHALESLQGFR